MQSGSLHQFDIPAQPLQTAIEAFIAKTGWQVGYSSALVSGVVSGGASGRLSNEQLLQQLLLNTGLTYNETAPGVITLRSLHLLGFSGDESGQTGDATVLDPIVVTAQRVEQPGLDVPISLQVITGQEIEERGDRRISDALELVPNVSVQQTGSGYLNNIIIRGIGNEIPFTDPAVSVFVDGSPVPAGLSDFALLDVERIEVMRGPQSTLFGQNSLAGAVNVVTRKPSRDGWTLTGGPGVGSFGYRSFGASLEGAVSPDAAGLRVSANYEKSDGYIRNSTTGNLVGGLDDYNLRAELDASLADNWDLSIKADHSRDMSALLDTAEWGTYVIGAPDDPKEVRTTSGVTGVVTWYGDQLEVVSQTGWRVLDLDFDNFASYPAAAFPFDLFNDVVTDERYLFQELRLVKPKDDTRFGWQVGAYLADESFDVDQTIFSDFGIFTSTVTSLHDQDTRRYEAFGQLDYDLIEDLTLTLGGRLSQVERSVDHHFSAVSPLAPPLNFEASVDRGFFNAVGRAALTYAITPDWSAYVSFNQGFKPGTARSGGTSLDELFLPSERSNTYEIGFKHESADTTFEATAFYVDYENRHTFFYDGNIPSALAIPESEAAGVEFSVAREVRDGWTVFGRLGYLYSRFGDYSVNVLGTRYDIGGNEFASAPAWTVAAGTRYEREVFDNWTFFASADLSYQSDSFGNISNVEASRNESYTLVNAGVGLTNGNFNLQINAENLLDTYYFASTYQADGRGFPGRPRTIMGRISFEFGS